MPANADILQFIIDMGGHLPRRFDRSKRCVNNCRRLLEHPRMSSELPAVKSLRSSASGESEDARVERLLSAMTLDEKIECLDQKGIRATRHWRDFLDVFGAGLVRRRFFRSESRRSRGRRELAGTAGNHRERGPPSTRPWLFHDTGSIRPQ